MLSKIFSVLALAVCVIAQEAIQDSDGPANVPLLSVLVPRIEQKYVTVKPMGNKYQLTITLPNGSNRGETVELKAPGTPEQELYVVGNSVDEFDDYTLKVSYTAGRNGYVASYRLTNTSWDRLSGQSLKIASG